MSKRKSLRQLTVPAVLIGAAVALLGAGGPAGAVPAKNTGAAQAEVFLATETVRQVGFEVGGIEGELVPANPQAPTFRPTIDPETYAALKRAAAGGDAAGPSSVDVTPKPKKKNFIGQTQAENPFRPPDTHAAVGNAHVVEVSNSRIAVYRKNDGARIMTATLNAFFNYTPESLFDPRVVYDHWNDRFVVSAEAFQESNGDQHHFVAFSQTGAGNGLYNKYNFCCFDFGDTGFWDYPQLGYDDAAIIISANFFFNQGGVDSRLFGLSKAIGYAGGNFGNRPFVTGLAATIAPPIIPYDTGDPHLLQAPSSGSIIRLYRCQNLEGANPACFAEPNVTVPAYSIPPNADQPGTSDDLDSIDGRFQNSSYQIGNTLYNIHAINIGGDAGLRWYEINHTNSTLTQNGNTQTSATSDDWNPSNAVNEDGEVFVTFSSTDAPAGLNAQVRSTGRGAADNSMGKGNRIFQSPTFYNPSADTVERWGDYSSVSLDPKQYGGCAAHRRAWVANEYALNTTQWANRHARIGFC
jgi:hypothetical protein